MKPHARMILRPSWLASGGLCLTVMAASGATIESSTFDGAPAVVLGNHWSKVTMLPAKGGRVASFQTRALKIGDQTEVPWLELVNWTRESGGFLDDRGSLTTNPYTVIKQEAKEGRTRLEMKVEEMPGLTRYKMLAPRLPLCCRSCTTKWKRPASMSPGSRGRVR
ncbi:MAG: hypothetical protein HY360_11445 [Verrucomicrobia bacterium]|nr:hypothetical protein [Verrucomicrobiota bacterium]